MKTDFAPFFLAGLLVLAALTILCFIRAVRGPKLADRIMAVNMIGTMTIAMILLLSVLLDETAILDVALIYAAMSFVAVIVLTKIYIGIYRKRKHERSEKKRKTDAAVKQREVAP